MCLGTTCALAIISNNDQPAIQQYVKEIISIAFRTVSPPPLFLFSIVCFVDFWID